MGQVGLGCEGRVAVVAGGGGGHEPFAAGLVGRGMLRAAVSGGVFSSPPAGRIAAAIRAARPADNAGVLLIALNYTGDRLNFGLAVERARALGIRVDLVVCGDDCALTSANKAVGRRGLVGALFLIKVRLSELAGQPSTARSVCGGANTLATMSQPVDASRHHCKRIGQWWAGQTWTDSD